MVYFSSGSISVRFQWEAFARANENNFLSKSRTQIVKLANELKSTVFFFFAFDQNSNGTVKRPMAHEMVFNT